MSKRKPDSSSIFSQLSIWGWFQKTFGRDKFEASYSPSFFSIPVSCVVFNSGILAFHRLNVLDRYQLLAGTVINKLIRQTFILEQKNRSPIFHWRLTRANDLHKETCLRWDEPSQQHLVLQSSERKKTQEFFIHSSAEMMFNLIHCDHPHHANSETLEVLKDTSPHCDQYQSIHYGPKRFRVSFGAAEAIFHEIIFLDVMYKDNQPILHIVDKATRFSASWVLPGDSTKNIWETFVECWCLVHRGIPNRILVD